MTYTDLADYLSRLKAAPPKTPVCLIMAEDEVELASTLRHHLSLGFGSVLLLAPPEIAAPEEFAGRIEVIAHDVFAESALVEAVNRLNVALPAGTWVYYCFNAEYLFFPFCETRTIRDLLSFHTEERRDAMLTYVIDLYAGDLNRHSNAVSLEDAHLDRSGYYALARKDPERDWEPRDRQMDFHGGLRWRFEEHIPPARRKIDRISIFRTRPGLLLRPDFTFSDEEYNTYACPWHHNLTAAVGSFRTAKALRTNPGSRFDIPTFRWRNSVPFDWHSQQLMDLGLMEPGQWF
ncbi:glycosyltransferase family 2 protein [Rhodobacter sp. Har01]|uniref:glycosyltransferase family 2 protein n=1 Tax=Rhodobacter sp. Har01 TaxID=2883999 RepID=UPI001D0908F1|nr:glycosyltransferase family 2 protein [Rhodobacter sp. Har01]MCB6178292.1 glycosyltransferase family 2 protein [Rhodobacter sp. Har01]